MAFPGSNKSGPRIVVLGGGNGTSHMLRALLPLLQQRQLASLHALVHMADDGGSTGRLRKQYAVGAVGDVTRCLLALSKLSGDVRGQRFMKALEYRFADGDFKGHTLRNALLAAMEITSDLDAAIATFARILQVPKYAGVIPTTLQPLTQQVQVNTDGAKNIIGQGQHNISWRVDLQPDPSWQPGDARVTFAEQQVRLNPRAKQALQMASHIIVAPGHTYGSILPTLASLSLDKTFTIAATKAHFIVVMTLLTTPKHTVGWSGEDFVRVYESYLGRSVDTVVANTGRLALDLVAGQAWVEFSDTKHPYNLMPTDVVSTEIPTEQAGDVVQRAVVVHDTDKTKAVLTKLLVGI
jgi:uncharacterized cofD-like protein